MHSLRITLVSMFLVAGLAACATAPTDAVRTWVDAKTAVAVTAQTQPVVLSREDFPAGVNVRDYAELGAVEVNRSGNRKRYLAVVLWSTVDRKPAEQAQLQVAFANITLWADDQPLSLQRSAATHDAILVSTPVFTLPSPAASEAYYEVSSAQLAALAAAKRLTLSPGTMIEGDRSYTFWRGDLADFSRFVAKLVATGAH